jgi:hypothetical protein
MKVGKKNKYTQKERKESKGIQPPVKNLKDRKKKTQRT